MKSDIEIAMEAALEPIKDVIKKVDIEEDDIVFTVSIKPKFLMTCGTRSKTVPMEN